MLAAIAACSSAGPGLSTGSASGLPDPVAPAAPTAPARAAHPSSAAVHAATRPIPAEYVQTPSGWAHPSCIHEVPSGAVVDDQRGDVSLDGKVIAHYDPCPYAPVFDAAITDGPTGARGDVQGPGNYSGWVEYTQQNAPSGDTWSWVEDTMWVPPAPAQTSGTLYYFPGLQPSISNPAGGCGILQPVMQWGGSPAGGGSYWSIGAWWWSVNGSNNGYHSGLSTVSTNDQVSGQMTETSRACGRSRPSTRTAARSRSWGSRPTSATTTSRSRP
jgi:hypothetical protein